MIKNKKLRLLAVIGIIILAAAAAFGIAVIVGNSNNTVKQEVTVAQAQAMVDKQLDELPTGVAMCARYLRQNTAVTVKSLEYGNQKNITLSCTYKTLDIYSVISENINELLNIETENEKTGTKKNATKIQLEIYDKLQPLLENAAVIEGEVDIEIYETENSKLTLYLEDSVVDTFFGGIIKAENLVEAANTITVNGEAVDISKSNSLKRGLVQCFDLINYDSQKPDVSIPVIKLVNELKDEFYRNFIEKDRWLYLAKGLGTTLKITAFSLVLGLVIGFIVAIIRCTYAKTGKLELIDSICGLYLSIMRGTPVMIQLLIIYFVLLLPLGIEKFTAAVLCFGINSGAYVAEIVRGGIMSVDNGQMEAGRSLGFTYVATMWYIVIPQAIKAVLPALANEFIALLKETSVAFYIGVSDLTQGGLKIRSITYSNFMPLIAIGLIYLVLVLGLSYLVSLLERRMNKSDRS